MKERRLISHWDKSLKYAPSHVKQGREPVDPAKLKKGRVWFDPITICPELQGLRRILRNRGILPPEPREYLKRK